MTKYFIFISLLVSSYVWAKTGNVKVLGTVSNPTVKTIKITDFNYKPIAEADLDDNGNFQLSAKVEDGYYFLNYGRNTLYVYLYPKDNLTVTFDAKYFDETIMFEGKGAQRNNYLAKKSIEEARLTEDLDAFYKVDEATYMTNIQNVKDAHLKSLDSYDVERFFVAEELKSLEYNRLLSIQNYKSNYKFYIGEEITPSEDFYIPVSKVKLNNQNDYNKQPYYRYLVNSIWSKKIDAAPDVDGMLAILRQVPLRDTVVVLVNGFYSDISADNERSKDYLDLIKKITNHQPFVEAAERRYEEVVNAKGLKQGDVSPGFSYESLNGKITNLSDLKGKYVYIDVWATWCAPCVKQVPYLKELENRYHDKNIVFISISVDKENEKETWKQFVKDKQLGGLQLFADKSFDSEFMNAYAVNSIPRFILIDPEGKIIDTEAPRPSFEKTMTLLDSLVKDN